MDTKDATEDVIDTSDAEEMELLEAQKPGYHQRVWGSTKVRLCPHSDIQHQCSCSVQAVWG
jgi:hypothetical protein